MEFIVFSWERNIPMSKKALGTLCILVVLLLVLAKMQPSKRQTETSLVQALVSFDLGAVKSLTLASKQNAVDKKIHLQQTAEGTWTSLSSHGYEAQTSKVNALILSIHGLKSNQKITSNPKNYSRLGLGEEDKTTLVLHDKEGKPLSSLHFGKNWDKKNPTLTATSGRYVRVDPLDTVYLVSQNLNLSLEQKEWLNTEFLKIEKKDIANIQLLKTTPQLSIVNRTPAADNTKETEPKFVLQGMQPGDKAKEWVIDQVINFFSSTYFSEVFLATDPSMTQAVFEPCIELKTKDGFLYQVFLGKLEKDLYLKLKISGADLEKTSALNNAYAPWIYKLESWTVATLNKSYQDMIEETPKPKTEPPAIPKETTKTPESEPDVSTPIPSLEG
jgi:hypothetical protein